MIALLALATLALFYPRFFLRLTLTVLMVPAVAVPWVRITLAAHVACVVAVCRYGWRHPVATWRHLRGGDGA